VIQAATLAHAGPAELAPVAIRLVDLFCDDYFQKIFASRAHSTKAHALLRLDRYDEACEAFEAALGARRVQPNVIDDTWLMYALTVALRGDRSRYERVTAVLAEFNGPGSLTFPSQVFDFFTSLALISADLGDRSTAARWAANALAAVEQPAPFARHPGVGVVRGVDASLRRKLEAIARHS
jgi:hypothetical protein